MKRLFGSLTLVALLLALPATQLPVSEAPAPTLKGHVPIGKVQVCHKGEVITVSENALTAHLGHADCQLPTCDFNNVFHTGETCNVEDSGDGKCVVPNPRDGADGVTPGCPAGTF